MKNYNSFWAWAVALNLWTVSVLPAQVPPILSYQGRVSVGTTNFDGTGLFKFALVDATGSTTYWSNDGSSTAGSEPASAVSLAVTKGLYNVLLGDSSLTNMTAVPAGVFNNADVRLRVWFDDGSNGSQLLAPDQRIAAVGYAMIAGNVPDGAITSAKMANGAIGSTQLASGLSLNGTLTGNASTATSATTAGLAADFSGSLAGNVTGTQGATVVATVGGVTAANVASGANLANAATNANTPSTIVKRDASGNFSAGTIAATAIAMPTTSSSTVGVITQNGTRMMHSFGTNNFFAGAGAGNFTLTGSEDVIIGDDAYQLNTTGHKNVAVGRLSMRNNTTGLENTAVGYNALNDNVGGDQNTGIGSYVLNQNTSGSNNTAGGYGALSSNTTGLNNTAFGIDALGSLISGANNTALGNGAGTNLTTGSSNNIYIGNGGVAAESSTVRIGTAGTQTRTFVAGIRGVTTGLNDAIPVMIDSTGQVGTVSSSRRYKEDINDMGDVSKRLEALRPVTFRYQQAFSDGQKPVQFGLIAEEVAEVFPELVVRNSEGLPETVKYQDLVPLLLNEVQKIDSEKDEMRERLRKVETEKRELSARLAKIEATIQMLSTQNDNSKRTMKVSSVALAWLVTVLFSAAAFAGPRASTSYAVATDTISSGGARSLSANYANGGNVGDMAGISSVASPLETAKQGFIGQLYEVTSMQVSASPTTINEGQTRQLAGAQLLDDLTKIAVPAASITWSVQSGPITGISAGGLATADTVYQNTPASVEGLFAGSTGTLGLTVLNVNSDDLPGYSADGIDDSWQVQYYGLNNPNAAPDFVSDGTGLTNLFKFAAGLVPNDPGSNFFVSNAAVSGQPMQHDIIFSPIVVGRSYTVQSSLDLSPGSWQNLTGFLQNDTGNVRTVTDTNAPNPQSFYRVLITKP